MLCRVDFCTRNVNSIIVKTTCNYYLHVIVWLPVYIILAMIISTRCLSNVQVYNEETRQRSFFNYIVCFLVCRNLGLAIRKWACPSIAHARYSCYGLALWQTSLLYHMLETGWTGCHQMCLASTCRTRNSTAAWNIGSASLSTVPPTSAQHVAPPQTSMVTIKLAVAEMETESPATMRSEMSFFQPLNLQLLDHPARPKV